MKIGYRFFVLIVLILALFFTSTGCQTGVVKKSFPKAVGGTLDLTGWDFDQDGSVNLDGEWEFYWGNLFEAKDFAKIEKGLGNKHLIKIPGSWNGYQLDGNPLPGEGYATFRLKVILPKSDTPKSVNVSSIYTAHKIWVNGHLVSTMGQVGTAPPEAVPKHYPKIINLALSEGPNEIVIQASNFSHRRGGIWQPITLGNSEQVRAKREAKTVFDMFLFGVLIMMGLYHLTLFLLRRKNLSALYFGVFCLLVGFRIILVGQIMLLNFFPDLPQELSLKSEYLTFYLAMPAFALFVYSLFPREFSKIVLYIFLTISAGYTLTVLFSPSKVYSQWLGGYQKATLLLFLYLFIVLMMAIIRKREGSALVLTGAAVFIGGAVNDILYYSEKSPVGNLTPYALLAFIFIQSLMLARRFSKAFLEVETMSEKLVAMDKLKDEFLAGISHELRTPLHGMIGIAESLNTVASGELNQVQKSNLALIVSSGQRLIKLVDDLLEFSRLKSKDIVLQVQPVDLKSVVRVVLSLSHPLAKDKDLELINEIPEGLPPVQADYNRLQQILFNLMANAIKFTPAGKVSVSAIQYGQNVEVTVADTGIGIPVEQHGEVFVVFEQGNFQTDSGYKGLGLGLSITKKLVDLHGGIIKVESEPGEGSKFTFTLPVSTGSVEFTEQEVPGLINKSFLAPDTAQNVAYMGQAKQGAQKVLVVDDELVNLQIILNQMAKENYNVITASNGTEALHLLEKEHDFDLVILDIMLPDLSGYEVCRIIRENYSLLELPVLMLTARNRTEDILAAFEFGANDYLIKPFNRQEILARVKTLLTLKKVMKQMVTAELQFLQAQIKPHFIYNTLNTVMAFCRTDPETASDLLDDLSNYLRGKFTLVNMDQLIPLEDELDFIKSYLSIEKARLDERLNVIYQVDPEANSDVPPLILQPIVENAVKHGIYPLKEGGTVEIIVKQDDGGLVLQVRDDGVGMTQEKIHGILHGKDEQAGIGLRNVNRRLINHYGQGLIIDSEMGKGTTVTIRISNKQEVSRDV